VSRENSPLGQAWRSHVTGRDEIALTEFQKITTSSPEDLDALYGLGLAQRSSGKNEEAIATFQRVMDLLAQQPAEDEDARNRLEMLRRMVRQQLEFLGVKHDV
jgi:cytochrome c-type biogenesis protein CcmH/NrfG